MPSYREISEVLGRKVAEIVESHEKLAAFHSSKASSYLKPYYEAKMAEVEAQEEVSEKEVTSDVLDDYAGLVYLRRMEGTSAIEIYFNEIPDEEFIKTLELYQSRGCKYWYKDSCKCNIGLLLSPLYSPDHVFSGLAAALIRLGYKVISPAES